MKCKIINKPISTSMSFGNMPIANGFLSQEDFQNEFFKNGSWFLGENKSFSTK